MPDKELCLEEAETENITENLKSTEKGNIPGCYVIIAPVNEAWDDLIGLPWNAEDVAKARRLEMDYAEEKKV